VGLCLKHLPSSTTSSTFNDTTVPWQRVINAKGQISARGAPSGAQNQAAALRAEGVVVEVGNLGELMVDFAVYGWFPRHLAGEEDMISDEEQ
jgi:methylated-DNA-protein-cysteine methyltransferase-like protein